MGEESEEKETLRVWREILLEISLRALKKVQLSHTPWGLNKRENKVEDINKLNQNLGVFCAYETTVAAEISNEFMYSMFTNGLMIDKEARQYEVLRELRCTFKKAVKGTIDTQNIDQQAKQIDLFIRRWADKKDEKYYPVFIELKRARNYTANMQTGEIKRGVSNTTGIKVDIFFLKELRKQLIDITYSKDVQEIYEEKKFERCLIYELVWGEESDADSNKKKEQLKKDFDLGKDDIISLRWLPLEFDNNKPKDITNWLWLALIEIEPPTDEEIEKNPAYKVVAKSA